VASFRLNARPARTAAAIGTLTVVGFYLIAQMIAAGAIVEGLAGIHFPIAVIGTGVAMLVYVLFGGMLATTWVQIVKAVLLLIAVLTMTIWVLGKFNFNPFDLIDGAIAKSKDGKNFMAPGLLLTKPLDTISVGLAFALGTAGLPHILIRFFTVKDSRAARGSVGWAVFFIGCFYVMAAVIGIGCRALLGPAAETAAGKGGNLAAPLLAQTLGGGEGTTGGDIFFAVISGIAFATILAVVSGLVISASGAVAHDLWTNVIRRERSSEEQEVYVGRIAAAVVGAIAIVLAILAGKGFNIQFLVGLAFSVAASANFPALLLSIVWRRFNTAGALIGVAVGLISSIALIILSPTVWPGPDHEGGPYPAIVSIPLGFLACVLGTLLSGQRSEERFNELRVRSETGYGSEGAAAPS
jgi:cation/acetate symporter